MLVTRKGTAPCRVEALGSSGANGVTYLSHLTFGKFDSGTRFESVKVVIGHAPSFVTEIAPNMIFSACPITSIGR